MFRQISWFQSIASIFRRQSRVLKARRCLVVLQRSGLRAQEGRPRGRGFYSALSRRDLRKFSRNLEHECCFFHNFQHLHLIRSVIQLRTTGQLKQLRRPSPWGIVHPCQRPSDKLSPNGSTAAADVKVLGQGAQAKACESLEPRIFCSRGGTLRPCVAGCSCLLQRLF